MIINFLLDRPQSVEMFGLKQAYQLYMSSLIRSGTNTSIKPKTIQNLNILLVDHKYLG